MKYYAHIVRYVKKDPDSPGNLKTSELYEHAYTGKKHIPEKFNVSSPFLLHYISLLEKLEQYTKSFSGLVAAKLNRNISIFLFDSLEHLNEYCERRKQIPIWDEYEQCRDTFLNQIGLVYMIQSPVEIEVDDAITPQEVVKNIE